MELVIYDSMVAAIDMCHKCDEVKEIRDKALALEQYARQAQNTEAERKACEVRIRAERRAGQLLAEMERGGGGDRRSEEFQKGQAEPFESKYAEAKTEAGISDTQAKRWQKLAEIPHEEFEERLRDPEKQPTTTGLIVRAILKPDTAEAIWLWGQLRDFERKGMFSRNINEIVDEASEALQSDVRRVVPQLIDWLGELRGIDG